ncbi:MAG: transporter substrate-binding domain-containing protein [Spirochaetales bacterium]|nr:transporter substrate-binding domain-containing protein [Spirochaetales bacterium]
MLKNIILIAAFVFASFSLQSEPLTISTIEGSPVSDICSIILTGIYEKAGLEISIVPMPAVRATSESAAGKIDGETHRVLAYGDNHEDLRIVPFSYYSIDTNLFTQRNNPAAGKNMSELSSYKFAILKGVRQSQELTKGFTQVQEFEDSETLIRFLMLRRADFAILSRLHGMEILEKLSADEIVVLEPPIDETKLYHYLHRKHEDLVPLLKRTMEEMAESGELAQLIRRAEAEVTGTGW